jgi:hypothetical protein
MNKHKYLIVILALVAVIALYAGLVVIPNIAHHNEFVACEKAGNVLDSDPPACITDITAPSCSELDITAAPECYPQTIHDVRNIWLPF